jgi:hypothetical protein
MKIRIAKLVLSLVSLIVFTFGSSFAIAQNGNGNRKPTVKGEMKESGKETAKAGKSLGHNVKRGRIVHGGKQFGKHVGRAGKHVGKGTKAAAKKTGAVVKNAAKP